MHMYYYMYMQKNEVVLTMDGFVRLSEGVSLGFHAMAYIYENKGTTLKVSTIAKAFGLPDSHMAKICQRLVKTGFLNSMRGPSGGVYPRKKAEDIKLIDIYRSIEGEPEDITCLIRDFNCDRESCIFGTVIRDANKKIFDFLNNTTIADIMKEK